MELSLKRKILISSCLFVCLIGLTVLSKILLNKTTELKESKNSNEILLANNISDLPASLLIKDENITIKEETNELGNSIIENSTSDEQNLNSDNNDTNNDENNIEEIVYDGLTLTELSEKLDRSLNSSIAGTGNLFASHSIELGLDPYLAVAIVLHETGCSWDCSELVKQCYNVGGQKGAPGCWGGSYQAFNSLEEGITSYLDNLYYNYYALGLTTPETINPKYAESQAWASKINWYIEKIKAA